MRIGAKYCGAMLLVSTGLTAAGCSQLDLQRFAPPGLVKYEDLAGDQPPNPEIQDRIDQRRENTDPSYPILAQQPASRPSGKARSEIGAELAQLRQARAAVEAGVAKDRVEAEIERAARVYLPGDAQGTERSLDEAREALDQAIEKADLDARRERGLPPRVKSKSNE